MTTIIPRDFESLSSLTFDKAGWVNGKNPDDYPDVVDLLKLFKDIPDVK